MASLEEIQKAGAEIESSIIRTPLVHSPALSRMFNCNLYFKMENLQKTGSFKIRGALNKIMQERDKIGSEGVVAASAGNHAQGVAFSARRFGVPATIVMPEWASITKQEATKAYGGRVVLHGENISDCLDKAREISAEGPVFIHPYEDPAIIAGQGTIALEILEDMPETDAVVVPIGGGGLISGIAIAAKALKPEIAVYGVEAEVCASAWASRKKGSVESVSTALSIADGICVKRIGALNFEIIRKLVDDIVLVEEEHIASAILLLIERKKILAEGAGVVALSAMLKGALEQTAGKTVVLVISGGNLDSPLLGRIINKGLRKNGRIVRLKVKLLDAPGSLSALLAKVAGLKANILHIYHDRNLKSIPVNISYVELELETRSFAHINQINMEIEKAGYEIDVE